MFSWFGGKRDLASFDQGLSRDQIIQFGRLVIVDDENSLLCDELKETGFAIDHDRTGDAVKNFDNQLYDVAIVDYHGVGARLGPEQGLSLMKHIRRVSPRTRVIAYTSRSLSAAESEFFTVSDIVLPKDMGLADSLALVESQLKIALSKRHLLEALLKKMNISDLGQRDKVEKALIKSLSSGDESGFKAQLSKIGGKLAEKGIDAIVNKMFFFLK